MLTHPISCRIISFSSGAGWSGLPRKAHYSAAKGALIVLSKTIAKEVGPHGIRCNCLVPGAIDTELLQNYHKRIAGEAKLQAFPAGWQILKAMLSERFKPLMEETFVEAFVVSQATGAAAGDYAGSDGLPATLSVLYERAVGEAQ